jgi:beta-N-acetylhexosaminidase
VARAGSAGAIVVGTLDGAREPGQIALVRALAATGTPTVAVAMRTPWDVAHYPAAVAAVCTYSIHPPALEALAAALVGSARMPGRLPVAL